MKKLYKTLLVITVYNIIILFAIYLGVSSMFYLDFSNSCIIHTNRDTLLPKLIVFGMTVFLVCGFVDNMIKDIKQIKKEVKKE